jgi:hypothetical protein
MKTLLASGICLLALGAAALAQDTEKTCRTDCVTRGKDKI